jgi:hypothetical protein
MLSAALRKMEIGTETGEKGQEGREKTEWKL